MFFLIPVLFKRKDPGGEYDGEALLLIKKSRQTASQDNHISFEKNGVRFDLTIKGTTVDAVLYPCVLCERVTLPYEKWQTLKNYSVGNFERL